MFRFLFGSRGVDNREPYIRTEEGEALALLVSGPEIPYNEILDIYDTPDHERYIHDGTPHQNPAVIEKWEWTTFFGIPYRRRVQHRYYPLTAADDGRVPDLNTIQQRIGSRRLRRGQRIEIAPMSARIERQAIRREDGEQLARGVPRRRLRRGPR